MVADRLKIVCNYFFRGGEFMKDKIRRKYFSNKDIEIMYLPDSLKFFKINDETKK